MSKLAHAERFQDLIICQKAQKLAREIFELSGSFPREEVYSLTSQIRRSSHSIGAQIAEAWAKRRYEKLFVSKLVEADGEQLETRHWLESVVDCGYLTREQIQPLLQQYAEIGKMLGSMVSKAALFCNPDALSLHEQQALYFIPNTEHCTPNTVH